MKVLAIDSSSLVASVAVMEDSIMTAEYTINYKKTHSQTLLPMLKEISDNIGLDLNSIDAIAIAGGPGSFTGLRIGSATAKGLGLALDKPLIHVPTLEAMAYNFFGSDKLICPIMDAKRNQVYTGIYEFHQNELVVVKEQTAMAVEDLIQELGERNRSVIFTGDGIPVYQDLIAEQLKIDFCFAPAHLNRQRAGAVGALGMRYFEQGKIVTASEHIPDYLRLSQAERELAEKRAMQ